MSRAPFDELPVKVLIVEDDLGYAQMLKETLDGITVKIVGIAYDGWTAIAMWKELQPAALVTDLSLPGTLDGPDVIRRIKEDTPNAIVVALTGTENDQLVTDAKVAGAQAVFKKADYPPNPGEVAKAFSERQGVTFR